jgi:hypothetical protein
MITSERERWEGDDAYDLIANLGDRLVVNRPTVGPAIKPGSIGRLTAFDP